MRVNYHTHTPRCLHALDTDIDYIQAGIDANLDILGFSDHAPFPDHDYGYRMLIEELEEYLNTFTKYKEEYKDKLTIMRGLEIEYLPRYSAYYEKLLADDRMDYLLLAGHFFLGSSGELLNIFMAPDTASYIAYAKNLVNGMKTGYFDHIVHPDLFCINQFPWDINCDRATDIILDAAATNDWLLEFNANGIRRGITDYEDGSRYPYPHERFWKQAQNSGIRTIIGSDCHEARQVWDANVETAYTKAGELGLKVVTSVR